MPAPPYRQIDNCARADESPTTFGGHWITQFNNLEISSNRLRANSGTTNGTIRWYSPTIALPSSIAFEWTTNPNIGDLIIAVISSSADEQNRYQCYCTIAGGGTDQMVLSRYDGGVEHVLVTQSSLDIQGGGGLACSTDGTTVSAYYKSGGNWTLACSAADSTYTTGFIEIFIGGTTGRYNNIMATNVRQGTSMLAATGVGS